MELVLSILAMLISLWTYFSTKHGAIQAERTADAVTKDVKYSWLNAKAEMFLALRSTYLNIHKDFPREGKDDYEAHRQNYQGYWINAYNEWYVTRKICPSYSLWEEFFKDATNGSLKNPNLKRALDEMIEYGFAFGSPELRPEFLADIEYQLKRVA